MRSSPALSVAMLLSLQAHSAEWSQESRLGVEYDVTVPRRETADFIADTSYAGIGFNFFFPWKENLYWGLSFQLKGWIKSEDFVSVEQDGAVLSGPRDRRYVVYPLLLKGRQEFGPYRLKPYVGVGSGLSYIDQSENFGYFSERRIETQGVLSSEIGLVWYGKDLNIVLGSHYLKGFTRSEVAALEGLETFVSLEFVTY